MFRLHYDKPQPIKTSPEIEEALKYWREINADPTTWARFRAVQFRISRVVIVSWGNILDDGSEDGFKESAIQTIYFSLDMDGAVRVTRHTNS